jgi:hypothetical protein
MKKLNLLAGITAVLFLAVSALPAYSAKPWPQGGEKGPQIPADFDALDDGTKCTDGETLAQNLFDAAVGHYDALGYTANNKDAKDGTTYPMPITSSLTEETPYKDQAAMAWDTYHAMYGFNKGKDVSGKTSNVVNKLLSNVSYLTDDEGNITIIDGGRITGVDLQGVYEDLADLNDCVTP